MAMEESIIVNGVLLRGKAATAYLKQRKTKYAIVKGKLVSGKKAAQFHAKAKKSNSKPNETTDIKVHIQALVKSNRQMKTLYAYYDNAYRQWGCVANEILHDKQTDKAFRQFRQSYRQIQAILESMKAARKSEITQLIQDLTYKLKDANDGMTNIVSAVSSSGVIDAYSNSEAINGEGRRLGLRVILSRTFGAKQQMDATLKDLSALIEYINA